MRASLGDGIAFGFKPSRAVSGWALLLCLGLSGCAGSGIFDEAAQEPSLGSTLASSASTSSANAEYDPDIDADSLNTQIDMALESAELQIYEAPNVPISFQRVPYSSLEGWREDDHGAALRAFRRSCKKLRKLRKTTILGGLASRIADWLPSCEAADEVSPGAARAFFELAFSPIRIAPNDTAKITSYYEPEINASRRPTGRFVHPIYAKPREVTFKNGKYGVVSGGRTRPFLSRGDIYAGKLRGRGLEIAYLADPVELYYLQIQGSGRLRFPDGTSLRVGFAAKNGHPYKSAAQAMINRGLISRGRASEANISAYVAKNPRLGMEMLAANPSYIFFRELPALDPKAGPVGALGIQLTAGRSIAVDRRYNPLAAPVWLDAPAPGGRIRKLVVAQDTGSAIKGAQRADYFWGTGAEAGQAAGKVNYPGTLTVLLPTATVQRLTDKPVR